MQRGLRNGDRRKKANSKTIDSFGLKRRAGRWKLIHRCAIIMIRPIYFEKLCASLETDVKSQWRTRVSASRGTLVPWSSLGVSRFRLTHLRAASKAVPRAAILRLLKCARRAVKRWPGRECSRIKELATWPLSPGKIYACTARCFSTRSRRISFYRAASLLLQSYVIATVRLFHCQLSNAHFLRSHVLAGDFLPGRLCVSSEDIVFEAACTRCYSRRFL